MRISGYGSGSGGSALRQDRRKLFRRNHQVGQRVVGAFMGWYNESLAWVEIDGQPLLAHLDADPQQGQRFLFVIKQLDPEITLQVLQPGGGALALAGMAQELWNARIHFERHLHPLHATLLDEDDLAQRKRLFCRLLQENPQAQQTFAGLRASQNNINAWLQANRRGQMLLLPWLLPGARDLEVLLSSSTDKEGQLKELTASFALPQLGHCELRMLFRPPMARYRLLLERPEAATPLQACVKGLGASFPGLELEAGGVGTLPPGPRTVLAAFLYEDSPTYLPRFSTHV